jgi:hypothetical protein
VVDKIAGADRWYGGVRRIRHIAHQQTHLAS